MYRFRHTILLHNGLVIRSIPLLCCDYYYYCSSSPVTDDFSFTVTTIMNAIPAVAIVIFRIRFPLLLYE